MWKEYKAVEQTKIKSLYSLFEAEYAENYSFSGEVHNFWECFLIRKGGACVSADGRVYNLKENELIFHKPMELHKFYINSKNGAKLFIFSFSTESEAVNYFKNKVFRLKELQKLIVDNLLGYIHSEIKKTDIPENINLMGRYIYPFENSAIYAQMITSYLTQLLLSLYEKEPIYSVSDNPEAIIFQEAAGLMQNNICLPLTIDEIAKHCNISISGLKRIFHKYAGMSVHKYFVRLRVKTAADLLKEGCTVTEAAEKMGFGSQAYFSAVFKRETGICAADFKKNPLF